MVVCAVDEGQDAPDILKIKADLGLEKEYKYFNSGVILFNLKALRENTSLEGIFSVADRLKDKLVWIDQDLLNALYKDNIKYGDIDVYNCFVVYGNYLPKKRAKNAAILHFLGYYKPWSYNSMDSNSKYWWKEAKRVVGLYTTMKYYFIAFYFKKYKKIKKPKKK